MTNLDLSLLEIWKKLLPNDEDISWKELHRRMNSFTTHFPEDDINISVIYNPQIESEIHNQLQKDGLAFESANNLLRKEAQEHLSLTIISVPLPSLWSKLQHLEHLNVLFQEPDDDVFYPASQSNIC